MREKLMTVDELAEMLGMTKTGIYQGVYHKRIPAISISKKCLRFSPAEIQEWLNKKKTHVVEKEPRTPVRRSPGRPRKNCSAKNDYISRLVEQAKKEVRK
jgi:excisionase family DNA binding protein